MKSKQGVTIAALIIAIIGLSIGFAAFSNTLTIRSSADVNPDSSNFRVVFSKVSGSEQAGQEYPIVASTTGTGVTATDGLINNEAQGGPELSNLNANFTEPGQTVTYNLFVLNTGKYKAYLKDLTMGTKTCEASTTREVNGETESIPASEQATPSLVSAACEGISISVSIGTATLTSSGSLNNQELSANGGFVSASVTIRYAEGSAYVDGPMKVEFGDITFTASSNPETSQQGGSEQQGGGQETPSSNVATLTSAQMLENGELTPFNAISIDATNIWSAELSQKIKNNSSANQDDGYYFNEITCSDNTLTNISEQSLDNLAEDADNYFYIMWYEEGNQFIIIAIVKKNGVVMTDQNYTSDAFKDLTFSITGSDN